MSDEKKEHAPRSCFNCAHFHKRSEKLAHWPHEDNCNPGYACGCNTERPTGEWCGECRRQRPTVYPSTGSTFHREIRGQVRNVALTSTHPGTAWPEVESTDWCGEFRDKSWRDVRFSVTDLTAVNEDGEDGNRDASAEEVDRVNELGEVNAKLQRARLDFQLMMYAVINKLCPNKTLEITNDELLHADADRLVIDHDDRRGWYRFRIKTEDER